MKKYLLFLLLAVAPLSAAMESIIDFDLACDGRSWKVGFEEDRQDEKLIEWVNPGETRNNFTRMVTVQYLPQHNRNPEQFFCGVMDYLKEQNPGCNFYYKVHHRDGCSIFGEWAVHDGTVHDQFEWVRVFCDGVHGTAILHYSTKELSEVDKLRPQWCRIMMSARMKNMTPTVVPCDPPPLQEKQITGRSKRKRSFR
ncbi:MAG: hypothetical protein H7A37_07075 [Chlamydiales bacterium]|nr:hypothetical protein [Chlamydiia bacterium]MCP5508044.1 hypothetical protein [Chlamydiales bacterium]